MEQLSIIAALVTRRGKYITFEISATVVFHDISLTLKQAFFREMLTLKYVSLVIKSLNDRTTSESSMWYVVTQTGKMWEGNHYCGSKMGKILHGSAIVPTIHRPFAETRIVLNLQGESHLADLYSR
jgi:hypothetical protein